MLNGTGNNTAALPPELRQLAPHAKDDAEAARAILDGVRPWQEFESDYAQRGPRAILDAAHRAGHNTIIDAADPVQLTHAAAMFNGWSLDQMARHANYVPLEAVQQHLAQRDPEIGNRAIINEWSKSKGVDQETLYAMGSVLQANPQWERESSSVFTLLDRVHAKVMSGQRGKSKADRTIEAVAEKQYRRAG